MPTYYVRKDNIKPLKNISSLHKGTLRIEKFLENLVKIFKNGSNLVTIAYIM